jgi:hypothetical protein
MVEFSQVEDYIKKKEDFGALYYCSGILNWYCNSFVEFNKKHTAEISARQGLKRLWFQL